MQMESGGYWRDLFPPVRIVWTSAENGSFRELLGRAGLFQSIWRRKGCPLPPGRGLLLDFGREIHGGIRILQGLVAPRLEEERPVPVRLRFGESVSEAMSAPDNQHAIHDVRILLSSMGETRFGNTGFRYVRIDNEDPEFPLDLQECSACSHSHGATRIGSFQSSDSLLNRIWNICGDTLDACISPLLIDGAKRDRLVWMGDLFAEIRATCTLYGKHPTIEKTLDFILEESLPTGTFNGIPEYLPYWFMSQMEYFRFCGDTDYLEKQRTAFILLANHLFDSFAHNRERLLAAGIVDWSNCPKSAHGYPALFASGCRAAGRMAGLLRLDELENRAEEILAELKRTVRPETMSKAAAAQAASSGICSPEEIYRNVLAKEPEQGLSTFHFDSILSAYSQAGKRAEALNLLRRYYGGMISLGAVTFWEQFDLSWLNHAGRIDELPVPGLTDVHRECGNGCFKGTRNSLCHGWAAAPLAWMLENILGIRIESAGFEKIAVDPDLCGLDWVEGACPTPFGEIRIRKEKGKEMRLELPANREITVI